jgi:hypothetical protein
VQIEIYISFDSYVVIRLGDFDMGFIGLTMKLVFPDGTPSFLFCFRLYEFGDCFGWMRRYVDRPFAGRRLIPM